QEVEKTIKNVLKQNSGNFNLIQLYVEYLIRVKKYNEALKIAENKIQNKKKLTFILKVTGEMVRNNYENDALQILEKYKEKSETKGKDNYNLINQLMELYAANFQNDHSSIWLDKIKNLLFEVDKSDKLLFSLNFKQLNILLKNNYDIDYCIKLAENLVSGVKKNSEKNQLYLFLGKAYRLKNNLKKSSVYYSKAVKIKKSYLNASYELFKNRFYLSEWDSLDKNIDEIFPKITKADTISNNYLQLKHHLMLKFPDKNSKKLFASAMLKKEQLKFAEAQQMLYEIFLKSNGYLKSYCGLLSAELAFKTGRLPVAEKIYSDIISDSSLTARHEKAIYQLAGVMETKPGGLQEAEKLYFSILDKYPAGLFADKARAKIEKIQKKIP
ncbi:MAG: hypothetical protein KAR38_02390, partial [Calditrichia bacterium]|nr:hypothetical protein [Calditrichia bacterium]